MDAITISACGIYFFAPVYVRAELWKCKNAECKFGLVMHSASYVLSKDDKNESKTS